MVQKVFHITNIDRQFILKHPLIVLKKKNYLISSTFVRLKKILRSENLNYLNNFSKIYMIGLGYKNFIIDNELFILIGDSNYLIFKIPVDLKVFCRKNQVYVLSKDDKQLFDFTTTLKSIKKINFYKGKGVTEFKNFKFTKLKVGKKQRFA